MGQRNTTKRNKNNGKSSKSARHTQGQLDTLPVLHPDLAGIDVGSREHYVSVPEDRSERAVRSFGCTTPDLREMADWLKLCGITHAVLESTGVYWVPVAMMLEEAGLAVSLVDAREAHRLSLRKSDVQDCQWIRQLYACGLLRKAFRPDDALLPLRAYWRQRDALVSMSATAVHHMHKALELMNLQVHKLLSDITGVTGMRIVRAIAAGQADPERFAQYIHPNCKASPPEFVKALTGHYAQEHVFALRQALARYDTYHQQIAEVDAQLQSALGELPCAAGSAPSPEPARPKRSRAPRRKNQAHFDLAAEVKRLAGVDLTQIEGIDALTAFTIITEQGIDMSAFPSEKHFASHLGLCPNNQITGGRVRKRRTRRVTSRAAHALRLAAQSVARTKTALGAFYRRLRARHGAAKANVATAHKLAKTVYRMLKYGEDYVARGEEQYEQQYRDRLLANLKRQAKHLGCQVLALETGQILS